MIGLFSDVHGNYYALKRVMEALKERNCSRIYCLGDVSGYYSMVNECIDLLRAEGVVCLKGNHDSYLLGESFCPRSNSVNQCIAYQKKVITKDNLAFLATLRPSLTTETFWAVHGGWNDPIDEYIGTFDFEAAEQWGGGCKRFFSGHTHIQKLERKGEVLYCNPGAVGQPRDHDWRAGFALLDDDLNVTLERVEYDVDGTAAAMKAAGFSEYYYQNLYHGCKIGEKVQQLDHQER